MANPHPPIARYLRERRESAGLTRAALSAAAGISPGLIQKIEQGTRTPTIEALNAMFDVLEVPALFRDHLVSLERMKEPGQAAPDAEVHFYATGHGFNCDARPLYHEPSARLAQERTLAFLERHGV